MTEVFGAVYSKNYDDIYKEKNYSAECDIIENIFRKFGNGQIKKVLDLGCGTGNHSIPLAERGYEVTGVDISRDMLETAIKKISCKESKIQFVKGDLRQLQLGETYDAILVMFSVLSYQLENEDVISALKTARKHLKPNGLLLMDFWYGPAVLAQRPGERVRVINTCNGKIIRTATAEIDTFNSICNVKYHLWEMKEDRVINETYEEHKMRFFFPKEISLFLNLNGFTLERFSAFPEIDIDPGEKFWNAMIIALAS